MDKNIMNSKYEYSYEDFLYSAFWEDCDDVEQLSKKKILSAAYKFYMNLVITENERKFLHDENYALLLSNERLAVDNEELRNKLNSLSYNRTVLIISISTVIITIALVVGALIPIL